MPLFDKSGYVKLRLGHKFALLAFVALIPVFVLLHFLVSEKNIAIQNASTELRGILYLQSVKSILGSTLALAHHGSDIRDAEFYKLSMDRFLNHIDSLHDPANTFNKTRARISKIRAIWSDNRSRYFSGPLQHRQKLRNQITSDLFSLIRIVGDESTLVLDTDLRTYYLMDVLLLKIPALLQDLDEIRRVDAGSNIRSRLLILSGILNSQRTSLKRSMMLIFTYNSDNPNIERLRVPLTKLNTSLDSLSFSMGAFISGSSSKDLMQIQRRKTMQASIELWDACQSGFRHLLEQRIDTLASNKITALATTGVLLVITTAVLFIILKNVLRSIRELEKMALQVSDGNLEGEVQITTRDELGNLATSFNKMIRQLRLNMEERNEELVRTEEALDLEKREHRIAERALSKSEILFSQLWEISVDGMRLTDEKGEIIAVNEAFCRTVGKTREELTGRLFPVIYDPDEHQDALEMYRDDLQNNAIKTHFERERILWNKKHVWFDFTNSFVELPETGKVVLSVINDITERKKAELALLKSEKRFRMLFNNANDSVFVNLLNDDKRFDRFTEVNNVACYRLGYAREELLQTDPYATIPEKFHPILQEAIAELLQERHVIFEVMQIRKDGRQFPVEVSSHLFEYDEKPTILSVARDITERKRVEKRLQKSGEQLRSLASRLQSIREEERTMIAREIHDELGQMLTVLKIQVSLLSNKLHRNQRDLKSKIDSAIQFIDRGVETVQRITAKLRPGILDELGLVSAIEWQTQDFQQHTGIACDATLPKEEFDLSEEKSTAIFRIFQEALTNIARHAEADHVSVILQQVNKKLTLEVTDNGSGIQKARLNDPNSLGLLGMKERALALGGQVNFYGVSGKGTNVKAEIPLG